ncbi:MAG: DNA polymerase IV [Candidatus Rokuibacteriota bacterium]|nr:MAG: DNA polymerase IV [Candidatus Rokubacteria bacterium]
MRIIAHLDMDAFFAAVEERRDPELRGRPVVIGADPKAGKGRGVVATASYAARKYGIRSATPISRAWRLAEAARRRGEPATVFLRGNHALYREVSARIMALVAERADAFEEASIDEAYLDLSSLADFQNAETHVRTVKALVLEREGLTCSVGIAPNKLVAKIASDFRKPDGLTVVLPEAVEDFLDPLSIRVIPGIGPKTEAFLRERGIGTIAELRGVERPRLVEWLGKWGDDVYERARGVSLSPVSNEWERKSVGEQETFEQDTLDRSFVLERARALAAGVFARMLADGVRGFRTVTVTVRFEHFVTVSRSLTAETPVVTRDALEGTAHRLLLPFFDERENPKGRRIRLIGVRVEKLAREEPPETSPTLIGSDGDG